MLVVSIPQAVSTVATGRRWNVKQTLSVSIPQAVSTVATLEKDYFVVVASFSFNTASGKYCCNEGISYSSVTRNLAGFNTASGKYCCNFSLLVAIKLLKGVSIPQAVSTVATYDSGELFHEEDVVSIPQAVSTVATSYKGEKL